MAKLSRVDQKGFGETGGTSEFGAFGSDALGTPTTTKNLATIQSLAPFLQGLYAATASANEPPRIQDFNGLFLLLFSQLRYIFQNGIPEWISTAEYYDGVSFVQVDGVTYRSTYGTDGTPNVNHTPVGDDGTYWEPGEEFIRRLKFDADLIGFTGYSLTDEYLNEKIQIARSHSVGDLVSNEMGNAPITFAAARSTTNPSYPKYNPVIPRGDGDHDISTTQTTQAVIDKFKNAPLTVGGYSSYAVNVSGSTITVSGPSTTVRDALLNAIQNCGFVNRWKSSGEDANYAASGPDWTYASRIYCVTIDGVDYPITAVSVGSATITVTGTPASGAQTLYVYPMRIAGSTTSARLRSLAGFVPVPAGDGTMTIMAMAQLMDTMQGHWHYDASIAPADATAIAGPVDISGGTRATRPGGQASPSTDGPNGTPRTSKNTSPRTIGVEVSTWLGALVATNWTTA
jgi:hypothetical protein